MFYPIEMTLDNAREFGQTRICFCIPADSDRDVVANIRERCRDHVLITGLNGSGKSTLAIAMVSILGCKEGGREQEELLGALISSNRTYAEDDPWQFSGKILFYNDSTSNDYGKFVEINAKFFGQTDRKRKQNRIVDRVYWIRESSDLKDWKNPVRFRPRSGGSYRPLVEFDEELDRMGISPLKYLLYWKQGKTDRFTNIKAADRFEQFAKMLEFDREIANLDRLDQDLEKCRKQENDVRQALYKQRASVADLRAENEARSGRNDALLEQAAELVSYARFLIEYNRESQVQLNARIAELEAFLATKNGELVALEDRQAELESLKKEQNDAYVDYEQELDDITKKLDVVTGEKAEIVKYLDDNRQAYHDIEQFISEIVDEQGSYDIATIQIKLAILQDEIADNRKNYEQLDTEKQEKSKIKDAIDIRLKDLEQQHEQLSTEINQAKGVIKSQKKDVETLRAEIIRVEKEIQEWESEKERSKKQMDDLENDLAGHVYWLNRHDSLEREIAKQTAQALRDAEKEKGEYEAEANKFEARLVKLKAEKEILNAPGVLHRLTTLQKRRAVLGVGKKRIEQENERQNRELYAARLCLDSVLPHLREENTRLMGKISKIAGEDNALSKQREREQQDLEQYAARARTHSMSVEEYKKEIEGMENTTADLGHGIRERKRIIAELEQQKQKLVIGAVDDAQEFSAQAQQHPAYKFQDIFALESVDLGTVMRQEGTLSLLKYSLFVDCTAEELLLYSECYHVPLQEFPEDRSEQPIPLGLGIKAGVPRGVAKRVVSWLRKAMMAIDDSGYIRDALGCRGYNPESVVYTLSEAAIRWHVKKIEDQQEELGGEIAGMQEQTGTFNKLISDTRASMQDLATTLQFIDRKTAERNTLNDQIAENEQARCQMQAELDAVQQELSGLAPLNRGIRAVNALLRPVLCPPVTAAQLQQDADRLLAVTRELQEACKRNDIAAACIETNGRQIRKVEKTLDDDRQLEIDIQNDERELQEYQEMCEKLQENIAGINVNMRQIQARLASIDGRIGDYKKYFGFLALTPRECPEIALADAVKWAEDMFEKYNSYKILDGVCENSQQRIADLTTKGNELREIVRTLEEAHATCQKQPECDRQRDEIETKRIECSNVEHDITTLDTKMHTFDEICESKSQATSRYEAILQKHEHINWGMHAKYKESELTLSEKREEENRALKAKLDLTEARNNAKDKLVGIESDLKAGQVEKENLTAEVNKLVDEQKDSRRSKDRLEDDMTSGVAGIEGYRSEMFDEAQYKLADLIPCFSSLYRQRFAQAAAESWMPSVESYVESLALKVVTDEMPQGYPGLIKAARGTLGRIKNILRQEIRENAHILYDKAVRQQELLELNLQNAEEQVVRSEAEVEATRTTVEGTLLSATRSVEATLNGVLMQMGFETGLEYKNEPGSRSRELELQFKTLGDETFRVITSGGEGLSGGEHAAVSLMIMYSIMIVKENDRNKVASGGYLLLDEWDANLDSILSKQVFSILKQLGKKIIAITPRTHSRHYLNEFGIVIKVVRGRGKEKIMIIDPQKEANKESIDVMYGELEQQEKEMATQVV
jgi:chromosome segregation ATPase